MDINDLSDAARKAAIEGGTLGWGSVGSSIEHVRYLEPIKSRRKCLCGCGTRETHAGMANGVALASGCELVIRRWVKSGRFTAA